MELGFGNPVGHDPHAVHPVAGDVLDGDVPELGRIVASPVAVVVRPEVDHPPVADVRGDVPHVQVLEIAAPVEVRLEIDSVPAAVDFAVFDEDIPHAARHFASDGDGPAGEVTAPDDHVFGRLTDPPAVLVAARLDGDAVVPHVEFHVFDQHVGRGFGIAAVVVVIVPVDEDVSDDDVVAVDRMDDPERGVVDFHVFDQHVLAAEELDHAGPQV